MRKILKRLNAVNFSKLMLITFTTIVVLTWVGGFAIHPLYDYMHLHYGMSYRMVKMHIANYVAIENAITKIWGAGLGIYCVKAFFGKYAEEKNKLTREREGLGEYE